MRKPPQRSVPVVTNAPRPASPGATGRVPSLLTTQAGSVQLAAPKLRAGSFFSSIFSPRRRSAQDCMRGDGGLRPWRGHPTRG